MSQKLFWALLEPGSSDDFDMSDPRGMVANLFFALYQLMCVIILLNLLIAVMNATTSKITDKKETYWIFTRTEVWIQFFDIFASFPPPFGVLNIAWYVVYMVYRGIRRLLKKCNLVPGRSNVSRTGGGDCRFDAAELTRRKEHALLSQSLIRRYYENCYLSKTISDDVTKEDLTALKKDILKEIQKLLCLQEIVED